MIYRGKCRKRTLGSENNECKDLDQKDTGVFMSHSTIDMWQSTVLEWSEEGSEPWRAGY